MCVEPRPRVCHGPYLRRVMRGRWNGCCSRRAQPEPLRRTWSPIERRSTMNSNGRASPCSCCGRNRRRPPPTACSTVGFVTPIVPGPTSWIWSCGSPIARARNSLWITLGKAFPWSTGTVGKCTRPPSLWRCSARPTTPTLRGCFENPRGCQKSYLYEMSFADFTVVHSM